MIDQTQDQNIQPESPASVAPAVSVPPPESPTVAVSGEVSRVPRWFYLVFGITLIIFFVVTTLLVLSLTKKAKPPITAPAVQTLPTNVPTTQPPPPTLTSIPDDLDTLEKELNTPDLNDLDNDLTTFDSEIESL